MEKQRNELISLGVWKSNEYTKYNFGPQLEAQNSSVREPTYTVEFLMTERRKECRHQVSGVEGWVPV